MAYLPTKRHTKPKTYCVICTWVPIFYTPMASALARLHATLPTNVKSNVQDIEVYTGRMDWQSSAVGSPDLVMWNLGSISMYMLINEQLGCLDALYTQHYFCRVVPCHTLMHMYAAWLIMWTQRIPKPYGSSGSTSVQFQNGVRLWYGLCLARRLVSYPSLIIATGVCIYVPGLFPADAATLDGIRTPVTNKEGSQTSAQAHHLVSRSSDPRSLYVPVHACLQCIPVRAQIWN